MNSKPGTHYRIAVIDSINKRALVAVRYPGFKVCAVVVWIPLDQIRLAKVIDFRNTQNRKAN